MHIDGELKQVASRAESRLLQVGIPAISDFQIPGHGAPRYARSMRQQRSRRVEP